MKSGATLHFVKSLGVCIENVAFGSSSTSSVWTFTLPLACHLSFQQLVLIKSKRKYKLKHGKGSNMAFAKVSKF